MFSLCVDIKTFLHKFGLWSYCAYDLNKRHNIYFLFYYVTLYPCCSSLYYKVHNIITHRVLIRILRIRIPKYASLRLIKEEKLH